MDKNLFLRPLSGIWIDILCAFFTHFLSIFFCLFLDRSLYALARSQWTCAGEQESNTIIIQVKTRTKHQTAVLKGAKTFSIKDNKISHSIFECSKDEWNKKTEPFE